MNKNNFWNNSFAIWTQIDKKVTSIQSEDELRNLIGIKHYEDEEIADYNYEFNYNADKTACFFRNEYDVYRISKK